MILDLTTRSEVVNPVKKEDLPKSIANDKNILIASKGDDGKIYTLDRDMYIASLYDMYFVLELDKEGYSIEDYADALERNNEFSKNRKDFLNSISKEEFLKYAKEQEKMKIHKDHKNNNKQSSIKNFVDPEKIKEILKKLKEEQTKAILQLQQNMKNKSNIVKTKINNSVKEIEI